MSRRRKERRNRYERELEEEDYGRGRRYEEEEEEDPDGQEMSISDLSTFFGRYDVKADDIELNSDSGTPILTMSYSNSRGQKKMIFICLTSGSISNERKASIYVVKKDASEVASKTDDRFFD